MTTNKKKEKKIKEILIAIVDEMYCFGHFMSQERAGDLIKKIEKLYESNN